MNLLILLFYSRFGLGFAQKVSKYGVFSGLYFSIFGLNTGKYGPEKTKFEKMSSFIE